MGFDIRLPIGYLFTILGVLLALYGLMTNGAAFYQRSLGLNINLTWGVVLLVFGLLMAYFAKRSQGRLRQETSDDQALQGAAPRQRLH
jgi:protein-S-isoprenylcysteine O-methyltransferase Ste14